MLVEVRVPAYPSEVFIGTIQYVSDIFKEDTQNDYRIYRGGEYGLQAETGYVRRHQDSPQSRRSSFGSCPETPFWMTRTSSWFSCRRGDEYVPLIVETGIHEADYVQILSGLQEGDVVVTNGNFQLKSKMYEDIVSQGHTH